MPPWQPEPGHGEFANDRRLSASEVARLERWVAEGAREGERVHSMPPPSAGDGWQLGTPDLIVELEEAFALRPGQRDVFRNFVLPVPIASARYVRGVEIRPGDARVVHHASLTIDPTRASRRLDAADAGPGFSGGMLSEAARSPESRAIGWSPGITPSFEPPDMAWRLEAGADVVLLVHMIAPADGVHSVRPRVAFFFTETPPTRHPLDFRLGTKEIDIAPGDPSYTVEDRYELPVDVSVLSIYPHAHYLAKEMKVFATVPGGAVTPLLWIRNWDFHWQEQYHYASPVALPRGAVVTMRYTYDNSASNQPGRGQAPRRVSYGPESKDEMGDVWLRLLPPTADAAATLARAYIEKELSKRIGAGEKAIAGRPADAGARNALGASYLEAGRIDNAIVQFNEAVRLAPDTADGWNNLGHVLQLQGKAAEALPYFHEAARLAPGNDLVHLNLGNALQDTGEVPQAIEHYRRAIALNPASGEAHNNLGVALGSQGNVDEAARHFRIALEIQPGYTDARRNLDLVLQLQKR
jgi:Flp pilus assembly protein TadD